MNETNKKGVCVTILSKSDLKQKCRFITDTLQKDPQLIIFANNPAKAGSNLKNRNPYATVMTKYKPIHSSSIKSAIAYAKATLAIEGEQIPEGSEILIENKLKGLLTHEEFRKQALEIAKRGITT